MRNLPQNIFAFLVLFVALILIMTLQRPHSPCDSQVDILKNSQTPFLYLDPKMTMAKTRDFTRFVNFCKQSNSEGGCLEFFDGMKKLILDLERAPSGCTSALAEIPEVKEAMFTGLELIVRLAWGEKPPTTPQDRNGWLDISQISIFCDFKNMINNHLGADIWTGFVDRQLTLLPGASLLPRNDVWSRTILADPCVSY